jgi:cellulose biosynthesis protein BcsQ
MQVIAAIASKGGVGKTTLLFALGVEAAKTRSVFFCDLDPQGSLKRLCDRRSKRDDVDHSNPLLLDGVLNIQEAKTKLERSDYRRDLMFVDTPGSMVSIISHAVSVADCVLIPVQPSMLDMLAQEDAAAIVAEHEKDAKTLFVLNRVDGRMGVEDSVRRIITRFQNTPVKVHQRAAYARAHIIGKSGAEIDGRCAAEISALWGKVEQITKGK